MLDFWTWLFSCRAALILLWAWSLISAPLSITWQNILVSAIVLLADGWPSIDACHYDLLAFKLHLQTNKQTVSAKCHGICDWPQTTHISLHEHTQPPPNFLHCCAHGTCTWCSQRNCAGWWTNWLAPATEVQRWPWLMPLLACAGTLGEPDAETTRPFVPGPLACASARALPVLPGQPKYKSLTANQSDLSGPEQAFAAALHST